MGSVRLLQSVLIIVLVGAVALFLSIARTPIQHGVGSTMHYLGNAMQGNAEDPSDDVLTENMRLKAQLRVLEYVSLENEKLRHVLQLSEKTGVQHTMASIIRGPRLNISRNIAVLPYGDGDVSLGAPVLWGEATMLGDVGAIGSAYLEVRTIYDPSVRYSVRVGKDFVPALLKGGTVPALESIARGSRVRPGDPVYISPETVPGQTFYIGDIGEVGDNAGDVFLTATLRLPYDINQISDVIIIQNP